MASPVAALVFQAAHGHGGGSLSLLEVAQGVSRGMEQGSAAFLAGMAAFALLVWLPVSRSGSLEEGSGRIFGRVAWALFAGLAVSAAVELSVYAVVASGEPFGAGLLAQALLETRTGRLRGLVVALGLLTALAVDEASGVGKRRRAYWCVAAGFGVAMLGPLVRQGHVSSEGTMPFMVVWTHVAGVSLWMGGLLGIPLLMLGPFRRAPAERRAELAEVTVRRFSRVATVAVMVIVATGIYSALQTVTDLSILTGTPYGQALIMKLGLMVLLLAAGGVNFIDRGRGPLGRMVGAELALASGIFIAAGFLSTLPPIPPR